MGVTSVLMDIRIYPPALLSCAVLLCLPGVSTFFHSRDRDHHLFIPTKFDSPNDFGAPPMGASYEDEDEGESSKSVLKLKTITDDAELESGQVKKKDDKKDNSKKLDSEEKSKEKTNKTKTEKKKDKGGDGDLSFKMAVTPPPDKNNGTQNRMKKVFFARGHEGDQSEDSKPPESDKNKKNKMKEKKKSYEEKEKDTSDHGSRQQPPEDKGEDRKRMALSTEGHGHHDKEEEEDNENNNSGDDDKSKSSEEEEVKNKSKAKRRKNDGQKNKTETKKKLIKSTEEPSGDKKGKADGDAIAKKEKVEPADTDHAEKGNGGLGSKDIGKKDTAQGSDSDDEGLKILEPRKDSPEDKIKEDKVEKKGPAPVDIHVGKEVKLAKVPKTPTTNSLTDKSANFHPLPKMDMSSTKVLTSPEERKRFLGMYQAALGRGSSRFKDILDEIRCELFKFSNDNQNSRHTIPTDSIMHNICKDFLMRRAMAKNKEQQQQPDPELGNTLPPLQPSKPISNAHNGEPLHPNKHKLVVPPPPPDLAPPPASKADTTLSVRAAIEEEKRQLDLESQVLESQLAREEEEMKKRQYKVAEYVKEEAKKEADKFAKVAEKMQEEAEAQRRRRERVEERIKEKQREIRHKEKVMKKLEEENLLGIKEENDQENKLLAVMQHERLPEASDLLRTKPRLNLPGESEELARFMDQMPDISHNFNEIPPLKKTEVIPPPVKQLKEKMMDERTGESVDKQEKIVKENFNEISNNNIIDDDNSNQWEPVSLPFNMPPPGEPSEVPSYDPQHPNLPSVRSKVSVKVQAKVHHEKLPPPPIMEDNERNGLPIADRQAWAWDQPQNDTLFEGGFDSQPPPQGFPPTNRFISGLPDGEGEEFGSPNILPESDRFQPPSAQEEEMIHRPFPPSPQQRHHRHHRDNVNHKPSSSKHHKSHRRHKSHSNTQNPVKVGQSNPNTSKTINIHITAPHADRASRHRRRRKKNRNGDRKLNTFVMEEPQYARVEVEPYPAPQQQEEHDFYHRHNNEHGNMFISPDTDSHDWAMAPPTDVEPTIVYSKERDSGRDTKGPSFPVPFRPPRDPLRASPERDGSERGLNFEGDNVS